MAQIDEQPYESTTTIYEQPWTSPTLLDQVGAGIANIPSSIAGGIGQLISAAGTAPDPNQAFTSRLMEVLRGVGQGASAGLYSPDAPTTEASQAQRTLGQTVGSFLPFMGLLKALGVAGIGARAGAPIAGAVMGGAEPLSQGNFGEALQQAITGAGGVGVMQETPRALQSTARLVMRPSAKPILAAEATQAANVAENALNKASFEEALSTHLNQRAALEAYQLQVEQAKQLSAAAQTEQLTRISDKNQALLEATQRAAPPTTTEQAYSFMHQGEPMSPIAMPQLTQAANKALSELQGIPKSLQPAKLGTIAGELTGAGALPEGMTPAQMDAWGPVLDQLKAATSGGTPTLDKVQQIQQGLGRLTRSSDPRVSGVAKHLYKNLMNDVEEAAKTNPQAGQFLEATKIARQNLAAEDLADFMTNHGSRVTKTGQIQIQAEKLAQKLRNTTENFPLSTNLHPAALADIQSALEDVFKVKSQPAIKPEDIITSPAPEVGPRPKPAKTLSEGFEPKRAEGTLTRHPFIVGALAGSYLGLPHAIGIAAALFIPRAIFRAAITPVGRKFIRALYADTPPMVNDMARTGALVNFLKSQGENIDVPDDVQQGLQQYQQQQRQEQQQQQEQKILPMMMMLQQGGGK